MQQLNLDTHVERNFQSSHHLLCNTKQLPRQRHQNTPCPQLGSDFQTNSKDCFQLGAPAFEKTKSYSCIWRGFWVLQTIWSSPSYWGDPGTCRLKNKTLKGDPVLGKPVCKVISMIWVQQVWDKGSQPAEGLGGCFEPWLFQGAVLCAYERELHLVFRHWLVKSISSYLAHASTRTAQTDSLNAKRSVRIHQPLRQTKATSLLLQAELFPHVPPNATAGLGAAPAAEPARAATSPPQPGEPEPGALQKGWSTDENQNLEKIHDQNTNPALGNLTMCSNFKNPPRAQMTGNVETVRPNRAHQLLTKVQSLYAPSIPQGPTNFQLTVPQIQLHLILEFTQRHCKWLWFSRKKIGSCCI